MLKEAEILNQDGIHLDEFGQAFIDYLFGVSIFLLWLIFIFRFTQGLFTPFLSDSESLTIIADRVSDIILEEQLADNNAGFSTILNKTKIDAFFYESLNTSNSNYSNTISILGLNGSVKRYELNVTMETQNGAGLQGGMPLPENRNIAQTLRIVSEAELGRSILSVRVW